MAGGKKKRLSKVLRELNISLDRAVDFLESENYEIEARPTAKVSHEIYQVLVDEFQTDKSKKVASKEVSKEQKREKEALRRARAKEQAEKERKKAEAEKNRKKKAQEEEERNEAQLKGIKQVGKIDLDAAAAKPAKKEDAKKEEKPADSDKKSAEKPQEKTSQQPTPQKAEKPEKKTEEKPKPKAEEPEEEKKEVEGEEAQHIKTEYKKLDGPNFTGKKIDLGQFEKKKKRKKRRRIKKKGDGTDNRKRRRKKKKRKHIKREEPTEEEVQKQVRETLEKLQGKSKKKGAKHRRQKREERRKQTEEESAQLEQENKTLKVTEFVTVEELATMMDVPVNDVISACMALGMMVTMNQRLDAETLSIVADEFGFEVEFVSADLEELVSEEVEDNPENMQPRAPIVTVMGHVDHGKTSLLDYIRKENVIAGESGGITQHIGAYNVKLKNDQSITFLDTPGHEAFTAMRARGAQVTDVAIIVIAADDSVKPQTEEAISHAQAAGVPIVFAINKTDLPTANPDKVKEKLANMNLLVEDWGGKIQSEDISAKKGDGVNELLEKVLLEAELLDLKADPDHIASGTVVEAYLDKGRGYVSTVLVQSGTLEVTDYVLAGTSSGKIKAMHDERGSKIKSAGPSTPVSILGLDGAPQAGDKFYVMRDEREAKEIASKREQLQREQNVRTQQHITLDEIGRRIALGDFKELNIILKGDVDGSVEALSDSFQKLSTEEIQVNIIHKGVGAITESDVLLASASDAIIIGFNVRPAGNAKQVADKEEIDIRMYSIIYDAIEELKDAMEGMLSPELKEEITGNAEIRETFKISKVGTIAGCMVTDGKIYRNSNIRLIRDGVVIYTGELASLKRFKDDVKEVSKGYECGLQIKNYNDIKEGDVVEAFQEIAVKKKLK